MTRDADDPMEAEFDTVAEWTAEVAAGLGPEYLIPAACRGSGKPAALDWLLVGLRARPGDLLRSWTIRRRAITSRPAPTSTRCSAARTLTWWP
ncbi:MAG: hypothetical protein ACRDPF_21790 [Streptosporangiaceae bacterium]